MSSHQLMPQLSDRSLVPAQDVAAILGIVKTMNGRVNTHESVIADHRRAITSLQDNNNNTSAQFNAMTAAFADNARQVNDRLAALEAAGAPAPGAPAAGGQGAGPGRFPRTKAKPAQELIRKIMHEQGWADLRITADRMNGILRITTADGTIKYLKTAAAVKATARRINIRCEGC